MLRRPCSCWWRCSGKGLEQDVFTYGALSSMPGQRAAMLRRPCSCWWICSGRAALSHQCLGKGRQRKALQLSVEIQRKGLEPDVITFSAHFSDGEKSDDDAEKALQLLVACAVSAGARIMRRRPCSFWWRGSDRAWSRM